MKKFFATLAIALTVLAGTIGLVINHPTDVYAESTESTTGKSLRLSPIGVRLSLTPGQTIEGTSTACRTSVSDDCSVQITNTGSETFKYKISFSPYNVVDGDNNAQFTSDSSYAQIARWLSVRDADGVYTDEATFTIKPGETQSVYYRIKVPDDIPGGSQYAILWAQILNETNTGGIQTAGQVGSMIIGRSTGEANEAASLSNVRMTRFALGGEIKASAHVKNEGNTDFTISYTYTATSLLGRELFTQSEQTLAFPGVEYDPSITWENAPLLGIFHTKFTIVASNQSKTINHIVIILPLFAIVLLILLLTVVITWIIIIIRKRKERKARKLI